MASNGIVWSLCLRVLLHRGRQGKLMSSLGNQGNLPRTPNPPSILSLGIRYDGACVTVCVRV